MSDYVQQNQTRCSFNGSESWVILSDIEQSIKQKVEAIGTPLKDWNVNIYRGILTGYNEAFIITTEKRDEILANCQSDKERERTEELIRPILRGRDIRRYGVEWAGLWIINTHNGIKGVKERINIEEYPAIKAHLDYFWTKISTRTDKGDTPYNLRNCAYLDDLSKQKIVWIELSDSPKFTICDQLYPLNTVFFLTGDNLYPLLGMLNSHLVYWYYTRCLGTTSGVGTSRWLKYTMDLLPLKVATSDELSTMVKNLIDAKSSGDSCDYLDKQIDDEVFTEYNLTSEEIEFLSLWPK